MINSFWIKKELADAIAQMENRTNWTPKLVPALIWADRNSKQLIGVPVFLYLAFSLDPDKMPSDDIPLVRYHLAKNPNRFSKRLRNTQGISIHSHYPKTGKTVSIALPGSFEVYQDYKNEKRLVTQISFIVPNCIDNFTILFWLSYCCKNIDKSTRVLIDRTEYYLDGEVLYRNDGKTSYMNPTKILPSQLPIKQWIKRRLK